MLWCLSCWSLISSCVCLVVYLVDLFYCCWIDTINDSIWSCKVWLSCWFAFWCNKLQLLVFVHEALFGLSLTPFSFSHFFHFFSLCIIQCHSLTRWDQWLSWLRITSPNSPNLGLSPAGHLFPFFWGFWVFSIYVYFLLIYSSTTFFDQWGSWLS